MREILCFAVLFFWARAISEPPGRFMVVWNVGQGAWSTLVDDGACYHVDMGGSHFKFGEDLRKYCGDKMNYLYITHFDSDHINFVTKAGYFLPKRCRVTPIDASVNRRKRRWLETFRDCAASTPIASPVREIFRADFHNRNDCNMYVVAQRVLITGDAPAKLEKKILAVPQLASVVYYLLGHHGSRTSSSSLLLDRLPRLRAGIASAEKSKYGHPHRETIERLRARGIPLLVTEQDGSIYLKLDEAPGPVSL